MTVCDVNEVTVSGDSGSENNTDLNNNVPDGVSDDVSDDVSDSTVKDTKEVQSEKVEQVTPPTETKQPKSFKALLWMWAAQSLPRNYIDNFEVGSERNLRDAEITKLLRIYVIMYRIKVVTTSIFKFIYPFITLVILCVVVGAILSIVNISIQHIDSEITVTGLTALISSLAALLATLFGSLKHMWKYLYDKNDETHVADIVKAVQANDLKNKQSEAEFLKFKDKTPNNVDVSDLRGDLEKEMNETADKDSKEFTTTEDEDNNSCT